MTSKALLFQMAAFGFYAFLVILLAGQAFYWNENRRLFYLGARNLSLSFSVSTFVGTWMSAASVLGYTLWAYQGGYEAFTASVNGWLLGLVFLPFSVLKLRKSRALSLPQWLTDEYGDPRLRKLSAAALLVAYILYIVIQFRVFGLVVSRMLGASTLLSSLLIYLFVIYTTFGGLPSVAKSDVLNVLVIVFGLTVAAFVIVWTAGGPIDIHRRFAANFPGMLKVLDKRGAIFTFTIMLGWGFGVASNPQYMIRIMSARDTNTAWSMLSLSAVVVGWIYVCLTFIGLGGKALSFGETWSGDDFFGVFSNALSPEVYTLLLISILAAAVSTANSQLLLAACSFCYDLFPSISGGPRAKDVLDEDRFLLANRVMIGVIATVSLVLSWILSPAILDIGQYSWAVVSICFFLPMYLPVRKKKEGLFGAIVAAFAVHTLFVYIIGLPPEQALVPSLCIEWMVWRLFPGGDRS
jgi:SSS family solute:Na+ symporter